MALRKSAGSNPVVRKWGVLTPAPPPPPPATPLASVVSTSGVAKGGGARGLWPPGDPGAPREGSEGPPRGLRRAPERAPKGPAMALKRPEMTPKDALGPLKT